MKKFIFFTFLFLTYISQQANSDPISRFLETQKEFKKYLNYKSLQQPRDKNLEIFFRHLDDNRNRFLAKTLSVDYLKTARIGNADTTEYRYEYFYNADGTIIREDEKFWNGKTDTEYVSRRHIKIFNSQKLLIEEQIFMYNDSTGILEPKHKILYEYNSKGLETKKEFYSYENQNFVLQERVTTSYFPNDLIQEQIYEMRDFKTGIFDYNSKLSFYYYENSLLKEYINQKYQDNSWINYAKYYFEYDNNRNMSLNRLYLEYISSTNEWIPYSETIYEHDQWNQIILIESKVYDSGSWINRYKYEYSYLGPDKLDYYIYYFWDNTNSRWQPSNKEKYSWEGELLKSIEWYYAMSPSNEFILTNKTIYIYDSYNNIIREEYYSVDYLSSQLILSEFSNFQYSGNLLVYFESKYINIFNNDTTWTYYPIYINNNNNVFHYTGCYGYFNYSSLVSVNDDALAPKTITLEQNFPNPFNPTTTIKFYLPEKTNVKLTIYDAMGREVKNLINEYKDKGYHEILFEASKYSSGVYFYKLETPEKFIVKKMLLIK